MPELCYNWRNFYLVNLLIVTALCSIKALLILVSWLGFIIKCVKKTACFYLDKEETICLNLEMGRSRLWGLITGLPWTKRGWEASPIILVSSIWSHVGLYVFNFNSFMFPLSLASENCYLLFWQESWWSEENNKTAHRILPSCVFFYFLFILLTWLEVKSTLPIVSRK